MANQMKHFHKLVICHHQTIDFLTLKLLVPSTHFCIHPQILEDHLHCIELPIGFHVFQEEVNIILGSLVIKIIIKNIIVVNIDNDILKCVIYLIQLMWIIIYNTLAHGKICCGRVLPHSLISICVIGSQNIHRNSWS